MYGRKSQLDNLRLARNDPSKPKFVRQQANRAYGKIVEQMKDRRLMQLRLFLIKAHQARDHVWVEKYSKQIRDYEKQDKEVGL